jgi:hypothetical protein
MAYEAHPYRLVTLLEILETSAEAWWRLAGLIGQLIVKLEPQYTMGPEGAGALGETLAEIQREAGRLQLRSALAQLDRIEKYIMPQGKPGAILQGQLRTMLVDLHQRMCDELNDRFFISVPSENVPYYRQSEPPFGSEVEAKFPQMSEDISESGKCIALGLSTAAVFHLMRVMEIGTQKLGDRLGVQLASEKNWQNILDEVNKAIKALDHKAAQTKAYAAASSHLYNVKLAWRNEVMHPKQTYTHDEATKVHAAVDAFICDLALIL